MKDLHPKHVNSDRVFIQNANACSDTFQVAGNYTQTTTTRISLWFSLVYILIFATTASVAVSILGKDVLPTKEDFEEIAVSDLNFLSNH